MKKLVTLVILATLAASPVHAAIGSPDQVPAATLLLPYFAVNISNANPHTVVSIGNVTSSEVIAHAVLWTDRGVPSLTFDIRLGAYDIQEIDLNALFAAGTLPQTTAGTFGSCTASLPPVALAGATLTGLQNAHRGLASTLFGGQCGGVAYGDSVARGYMTIDVTSECNASVKLPTDAGYFVAGGTGVATNNNALFGEYSVYDTSANYAHGDALVAIEASASDPLTDGPPNLNMLTMALVEDYTFYRRQTGTPDDNRESLPNKWMGRYVKSGALTTTYAVVWRDPGSLTPFACNNPPVGLNVGQVLAFDEQEHQAGNCPPTSVAAMPYAAEMIDLSNAGRVNVPFSAGFMDYELDLPGGSGAVGTRNQAFVTQIYRNGDDRAQTAAWPFKDLGETPALTGGCFQCNDGVDNDGDGDIDFPADSGCRTARGVENPACSDGLDNDSDTKTDYPDDPECWGPLDQFEDVSSECDDGIDNDLDGLVDWPNDPRCNFNPASNEFEGTCGNGLDDDMDGLTDFPADKGCSSRSDSNETNGICADGIDNDGDGKIDFPADPGCVDGNSVSESPQCSDGVDNDGDGKTDFPTDLACTSAAGGNETSACSDGVDNDGDGFTDFPSDPGCASGTSNTESPHCSDQLDNDGDTLIDFPTDPGCRSAASNSEITPRCANGLDDDGDGTIDLSDTGCTSDRDESEGNACSDGEDNDNDGLVDFPNDPGCASAADNNELAGTTTTQCSDGIDNDGDGRRDHPGDTGCQNPNDDLEFAVGDVLATPRNVPAASSTGLATVVSLLLFVAATTLRRRPRRH